MRIAALLVVLFLPFALNQHCSYAEGSRLHKVDCRGTTQADDVLSSVSFVWPENGSDSPRSGSVFQSEDLDFDWQGEGPIELLSLLQTKPNTQAGITCFHEGWIKATDIPALIALLDSKIPCSSVSSNFSSAIHPKSTVGHEASYLIEGFRQGEYPPYLNSTSWKADRLEILKWWEDYRSNSAYDSLQRD